MVAASSAAEYRFILWDLERLWINCGSFIFVLQTYLAEDGIYWDLPHFS